MSKGEKGKPRRLRVLALMHQDLIPPESLEGLSGDEVHPIKMEWDVRKALIDLGHDVAVLGVGDELQPIRRAIEEHEPHVCFNLLTHFLDLGAYRAHVVSFLELLKAAYTGCNPRGLILAGDKGLAKKILAYHRIRAPRFAVYPLGRTVRSAGKLRFPLFVKSLNEDASMAIAQASIVRDLESLRERVSFVHKNLGTDVITEEYVEGREMTVSVLGNERLRTFPVQELTFTNLPPGSEPILTSRAKWDLEYQKKIGIETGPAKDLPEKKAEEIAHMGKRMFRALGLSGYARVDLRLAPDGRVYVIEVNPNPDLCDDEDFAVSARSVGLAYPQLIQNILTLGMSYRPGWKAK